MPPPQPPSAPSPSAPAAPQSGPPRLRAADLFQSGNEVEIVLGDELYRLRLTRNGKLILTK